MEFREVINQRYSCRKFDAAQISEGQLKAILEAGRVAPTAKNLQEQRIYVMQSDEALAAVDKVTRCRFGAPTVLAVAFDTENVFVYPGGKRDSGAEDAAIVATHMMLAAKNEGVESCWINLFDPDEAKEAFGLPENEEVLMLLDLGYAAAEAGPSSAHGKRKELGETVTYR